jgi:hypothetical protein
MFVEPAALARGTYTKSFPRQDSVLGHQYSTARDCCAAVSSVGRLLTRTVLRQLFSVILLPTLPYSVLGIANPTTEHQPHTQTRYLIRDFF